MIEQPLHFDDGRLAIGIEVTEQGWHLVECGRPEEPRSVNLEMNLHRGKLLERGEPNTIAFDGQGGITSNRFASNR